jgi:hypothetical protein
LRSAAKRSLRMARVLAAGGFPEEAMPLIAKAVRAGAAARLAELGDLAAGVSAATPAQIRDMRRRRVLCAAVTLPVATSKAANKVLVPLRL